MKKNNLILIILAFVNFVTMLLLTILVVPKFVPYFCDINENIVLLGSKWMLLFCAIIPLFLSIVSLIFENNKSAMLTLNIVFTLCLYENMLKMFYFCTEKTFVVGSKFLIPVAVSVFMPLAVIILVLGQKIKHLKYKSVLGLGGKYSAKTEFLWKQTHFYASKVLSLFGVLTFFISIPFAIFRHFYIELALFVIGLVICFVIIYLFSKSIYTKFMEMETRKEKLQKKAEDKTEEKDTSNTKKEETQNSQASQKTKNKNHSSKKA